MVFGDFVAYICLKLYFYYIKRFLDLNVLKDFIKEIFIISGYLFISEVYASLRIDLVLLLSSFLEKIFF